jgi:hypothetical protein
MSSSNNSLDYTEVDFGLLDKEGIDLEELWWYITTRFPARYNLDLCVVEDYITFSIIRAIQKWKPDGGASLRSYIMWYLKGYLVEAKRKKSYSFVSMDTLLPSGNLSFGNYTYKKIVQQEEEEDRREVCEFFNSVIDSFRGDAAREIARELVFGVTYGNHLSFKTYKRKRGDKPMEDYTKLSENVMQKGELGRVMEMFNISKARVYEVRQFLWSEVKRHAKFTRWKDLIHDILSKPERFVYSTLSS